MHFHKHDKCIKQLLVCVKLPQSYGRYWIITLTSPKSHGKLLSDETDSSGVWRLQRALKVKTILTLTNRWNTGLADLVAFKVFCRVLLEWLLNETHSRVIETRSYEKFLGHVQRKLKYFWFSHILWDSSKSIV